MASVTNFGKGFIQSVFSRLRHPDWTLAGWGEADWTQRLGVEQYNSQPALWLILVKQAYFTTGIDVTHRTLGNMHARTADCIFGYNGATGVTNPHTTANRWYIGNQLNFLTPTDWSAPVMVPDQSTLTIPTKLLTFQTSAQPSQFPMNDIAGAALCTSNSAASATEVVAIYNFSTGAVNATSSGQTLTISNGTVVLTEA